MASSSPPPPPSSSSPLTEQQPPQPDPEQTSEPPQPPPPQEEALPQRLPPPPPPPQEEDREEFGVYKTKSIQFLGRSTPIILQNDNGPCPLLAICNVLLLRNQLNLPDSGEVSQEKLLSLVAERLIDSNTNVNNKDAGYVENQQQNISDAIDLLPRLATGIDVNIKFRRIDDFEFTPECAIFDLLDIPLYHGWIVDPQDLDTANAIGPKSYNAIMGELVALETQYGESSCKTNSDDDCVDFAAATTAALGVPSPCVGKSRSFGDSPQAAIDQQNLKIGDREEEEELLRALKLSEVDTSASASVPSQQNVMGVSVPVCSDQNTVSADSADTSEEFAGTDNKIHHHREPSLADGFKTQNDVNETALETISGDNTVLSLRSDEKNQSFLLSEKIAEGQVLGNGAEKRIHDPSVNVDTALSVSSEIDTALKLAEERNGTEGNKEDMSSLVSDAVESCPDNLQQFKFDQSILTTDVCEDNQIGDDANELSFVSAVNADSHSSIGKIHHGDAAETLTSSVDGSEPIYEGEDCISDPVEDREPIYEGEVVLAEQADKSTVVASKEMAKCELTPQQGELIKNFLKNSASQLTFYGLFCLQGGLKERELCVFFRNNHFSTMFKYNGDLYLLATDQGYINQPDLVWEKLNEVNGDTLFMTGYFKEFKMESNANGTWDEQNAMTSTADYLSSINTSSQAGLDMNSDLQLAIALQQQEFEQQPEPQNQQPQNQQQTSTGSTNRLFVGPQAPRKSGRSSSSTSRPPEPKSKEKCIVM